MNKHTFDTASNTRKCLFYTILYRRIIVCYLRSIELFSMHFSITFVRHQNLWLHFVTMTMLDMNETVQKCENVTHLVREFMKNLIVDIAFAENWWKKIEVDKSEAHLKPSHFYVHTDSHRQMHKNRCRWWWSKTHSFVQLCLYFLYAYCCKIWLACEFAIFFAILQFRAMHLKFNAAATAIIIIITSAAATTTAVYLTYYTHPPIQ